MSQESTDSLHGHGSQEIAGLRIGSWFNQICLTFMYLIIFAPIGFGVRLFKDPLDLLRRPARSFWKGREVREVSLDDARKGF